MLRILIFRFILMNKWNTVLRILNTQWRLFDFSSFNNSTRVGALLGRFHLLSLVNASRRSRKRWTLLIFCDRDLRPACDVCAPKWRHLATCNSATCDHCRPGLSDDEDGSQRVEDFECICRKLIDAGNKSSESAVQSKLLKALVKVSD